MGTPAKLYTAKYRGVEKTLTANEWSEISIEEYKIAVARYGVNNAIPISKPKTISRRAWMMDNGRATYTPEQIVGQEFIECTHKKARIKREVKAKELTMMDKFLRKSLVPVA